MRETPEPVDVHIQKLRKKLGFEESYPDGVQARLPAEHKG